MTKQIGIPILRNRGLQNVRGQAYLRFFRTKILNKTNLTYAIKNHCLMGIPFDNFQEQRIHIVEMWNDHHKWQV